MPYQRKTRDEYQLWQHWGHGWEEVCAEDTRREAMARLREYRENQPGVLVKIVKRRVRIASVTEAGATAVEGLGI